MGRLVPVLDPPASVVDDDENGPVAAADAAEKCRDREAGGDVEDVPGKTVESTIDGREIEERRTGAVVKVVLWMSMLLLFKDIGGERVAVQCAVAAATLGLLSSLSFDVKSFSAKVVAILVIASEAASVVVVAVVVVVMVMVEIVVDASSGWATTTTGSWARAEARSSDATVVETVRYFRAGRDDDEDDGEGEEEEEEDFVVGHMHTTGRLVDGNDEGSCCCPEDIVVGELGVIKEEDDAAAGVVGVVRGSGTD